MTPDVAAQVTMPAKSFDAPISTVGGHKAGVSPNDEAWGELVATNSDDVEGADNTLLSKLAQNCVRDLLQQDVNQLLNTLQPRERNVRRFSNLPALPFSLTTPSLIVSSSSTCCQTLTFVVLRCLSLSTTSPQILLSDSQHIFFHCTAVRGNHFGYADQLQQHSIDKR